MELKSVESLGSDRYKLTIDEVVFEVVFTQNDKILGISGPSEFFRKLESEDIAATKALNSAIFQGILELRK